MKERKPILEIQHLSKDFTIHSPELFQKSQKLHALSDINLCVYEGETLGVIGESGCGKSTLGRCIVGLHQPTSGEIIFDGTDITSIKGGKKKELKRNIQMIFQDPYSSLNPKMTAGKAVEEPLLIHSIEKDAKKREQAALALLKKVGLDIQHAYRYPHEFSGGQRQRISVARALSLNPRIIVCDEPVSALDVSIQAQVLNLFADIQKEFGLTYVFISHDLSVIKHISDRIVIMYLGRVVELCEAGKIYENPLHPYTKSLLSAVPPSSPFEKKERIELKGDIPSPIGEQKGCPLAGRCPYCMERCKKERPELLTVEEGHQVACFLYEKESHAAGK